MLLYIAAAHEIALRLAARGGLSLFGELLFVYLFAHRRAVRILRTGYLLLFIFRFVQLRILLKEYQAAADDLNDLGLRLCRYLLGDLARGLGCCLEQYLSLIPTLSIGFYKKFPICPDAQKSRRKCACF